MPLIRCSNEAYKLLREKALQRGEPISILLDRIIWGLETIPVKPKPEKVRPKAEKKPKAKVRPEDIKWLWRTDTTAICSLCNKGIRTEYQENHWKRCKGVPKEAA